MPNHVENRVRISLTGMNSQEFFDKIRGEGEVIDFNTIIPETDEVKAAIDNNIAFARDGDTGGTGWYDWRCNNWGTKWNAYDAVVEDVWDGDNCADIQIAFTTAWSPPFPIIDALRQWPEVEAVYGHYIEEFAESAGVF